MGLIDSEIFVWLIFPASYDSQSSVPTTDMSVDMHGESADHQPDNPQRTVPQPRPSLYGSADVPYQSPGTHKVFILPCFWLPIYLLGNVVHL